MLDEGRLPPARWAVWALLYREPGRTRNELDRLLSQGQPNPTFSRRLTEMERSGVIERGPARRCTVSGHKAETWYALDRLPTKPVEPPQRRTKLLERLALSVLREIEEGVAERDPVATVARWRSVAAELHLLSGAAP
jgi:hypothetical protein